MRKQFSCLTPNGLSMANHFELFNLPVQFTLDGPSLDTAYREIQRLVHPDRFVTATEAEKRTALQWAAKANDAYQTLRHPLKRAAYLCELNGYDLHRETHVAINPGFLMQQIEWRETLEQARETRDLPLLEKLDATQRELRRKQMHAVEDCLNSKQFDQAVQEIRKMMFLEKFNEEISRVFDELDSAN